ncbi:MAG: hypothetical protein ACRD34_09385 [Bryobacteraceae bacterium]
MTKRQFHVLYREFLFRMVDRELLSAHAQGDASKLLGQIAAILVFVSLGFTIMLFGIGNGHKPREAVLVSAWPAEHMLLATTMLVVGIFAVLSWDSMFPSRHDVFVLAPLPVRTKTILLAKLASLAAALSYAVVLFNGIPGLLLPFALAPRSSGILDWLLSPDLYRTFAAYWITTFAAGAFILCCVLTVQGLAAQLPRRLFLRLSALLQMAALCLFICAYFLQPPLNVNNLPDWLPSYWFLGLFQELNGSMHPMLAPLARRALIGLALAVCGAVFAYALCYFRILRKIAEEPDILPGVRGLSWLPRFGNSLATAVVQFSIRTLCRSRRHRLILAFYAGIGFAILIVSWKGPVAQQLAAADPWHQVSLPLLASSFVMLCFWMLGVRIVFAMPVELSANWIFRITQLHAMPGYLTASRRAMLVLAVAPVWAGFAIVFLWLWPWRAAIEHLSVLGLLGVILAEVCLYGFAKIPFTCSYLPGRSNLHITFCVCMLLGLNIIYWAALSELRALADPAQYAWIVAALCAAALCARWRNAAVAKSPYTTLRFEQEQPPVIIGLGLKR